MNMPLVWDKTANAYTKKVHPTSLSVYQSLTPLSTANMTLPEYESVSLLDMVLISTPDGKQEAYRVASITTDTDTKEQNVYLEHCACTLGDSVIPDEQTVQGKTKTVDIKGTISYVLSALLGYQTPVKWSVGTVAATTTIYAVIGGMTVLDAINDMMTQIPAYQAVFVGGENNWHVDIVLRPTTPVCEARLSRNIEGCEISTSSQGLCTRVMSSGLSGGHLDSENINEVGVFAENMMLNDNLDAGQKYAIASAYLAAHSVPAVSVTISGLELSHQTGLPLDRFDVGTVCRLTLPEMNVVVNEVIVDKRYADALDDPDGVTFTLANAAPDLSIAVAQVMKASGMGGGRANSTAAKEVKEEHKRYETKFEQTDQYFRLLATDSEWDELGNQNITAYSQIVQTSANIQSVVTQTGSVTNVFDPTVSYHIGDRVLHGGVAYKFIQDHLGTPENPIGWIGTGENGDVVEVQNMYSQIDQTAEGVSSIVGQTGIVTEVFDKNKIYTPGMKVLYQGIAYEFTGTHAIGEDWNPSIVKLADSLQSQIIQEAGRISTEISRATGAESNLTSKINQEAGRIDLVVEKKNGQDVVKRSAIIAAINENSESTVTISADKIDLTGYVTASEIFATDTTIGQYLTANNAIFQTKVKTAALEATNGATIESGLSVSDGSTLTGGVVVDSLTVGYPASSGHQVTSAILGGMIKTASLDTSTNTLTLTKFNGDVINFSKAASQGTYAEGWGAAFQKVGWPTSGTSNAYIDVSAPIATVDGPADLRRFIIRNDDLNNDIAYISTLNSQNNTYTNYAMLNHGKYTAGQNSVTAVLTSATPPSGTTPSPLTNGTYGVFLSKGGVLDSTAVSYHSVTSGGSATYVVSTNGEPIMVWNGLSVVGSLYPNTDVVVSSTTDQLGRRQISYNSGTISRSGYVTTSTLSSTKGSTNYPGRIGWTDEGGSGASRSVTSLSTVVLASTDTTTSTHTVDVSYSDGNTVLGGATVTVDASAISGGGGANLGHRRFTTNNTYYATDFGLDGFSSIEVAVSGGSSGSGGVSGVSRYAQSNDSTDFSDWTFNDTKTQSQKYAFYKIAANDGTVFNFGVDASAVYTAGQQSGGGSTRTVSSLSSITLASGDTGTSTKNTTVTYTTGSNSTASISINASNVYQQGVSDGYDITTSEISAGSFQVQTGSTSGRTSAGSISGQSVYNARNSGYLFFSATCRGKTRNFYVAINA